MDADVTDSPGTPGEPNVPPQPLPTPRRRWLRWVALGTSVVVLGAAGAGWYLYKKLDGNIRTDSATTSELKRYEAERPPAIVHDAQNILLIGSDNRGGGNGKYGRDSGTQRSDTTILLHVAADRRSATGMSIPRDLVTGIPACRKSDGSRSKPQSAQFNWAFEFAGAACTIRTVEQMTGVRVDHHMIVDFNGFKKIVNAVDGVDLCLAEPIKDKEAHLDLPAGRQVLRGEDALGYVRARYSIGDGSDTERMDRQQEFLGALVKKVQSDGVLLNPAKLYPVLDAATSSLTTDEGLDTLKDLYNLVRGMRGIPSDQIRFLTVPRQPNANDPNRDELVQPAADKLFKRLRDDRPVTVRADAGKDKKKPGGSDGSDRSTDGSTDEAVSDSRSAEKAEKGMDETSSGPNSPSGSPTPSYRGTTADHDMCGQKADKRYSH
ncbi:LCP family protein [Streptomyces sp. H27-D2]|uniref:LCP family protein n=1 Tax=Streptomyces sp. H27-D2 TaxID=3046304 RepID=UPI002DB969FE|nr:LCP family protein [Streptomyces sp. H27-D2]MEC4018751.1 LCP family protein [Streptomyces sp. H27-D2]